jgi:AraC family transcriptional regulator
MASFFGVTLRSESFDSFRLVETRHALEEELPWHRHEKPYLTFVLRGGYQERTEREANSLERGTAVAHRSGTSHSDRFGSETSHLLNVEFLGDVCEAEPLARLFDGPRKLCGKAVATAAPRLVRELTRRDRWSPFVIEATLVEFAATIVRDDVTPPATSAHWLSTVDEVIDERFDEPLTLSELAAAAGVHPSHLARTYRQMRGMTIGDRIRARRIDRAKEELVAGVALADVAVRCGFADQSHFTRWFVRLAGETPAAFRRRR